MKPLTLLVLLGGLCAGAHAQAPVESVTVPGAPQRFYLPTHKYDIWYDEFDQIKGTYRLSNGKTLELSLWGNRMYAQVQGMPRRQLVAAAPYSFVSRDRLMKITLDVERPGPIVGELDTVPGVLGPVAQAATSRFAVLR